MVSRERSVHADILALVTDAFGGYGGIAQYNRDFLKALSEVRANQRIAVYPRISPEPPGPTPSNLLQYPAVKSRTVYAAQGIAAALKVRPSIIFCGHLYHAALAVPLARVLGAKVIVQLHGTEIWGELSTVHRAALEAADLLLVVSRDTRRRALEQLRLQTSRIVVMNNTVGPEFRPVDRRAARERFGLGDEVVVLTVARLDAREGYKGHDRVITESAKQIRSGRKLTYLIAGVGSDRPRLEALARELGIAPHVRFLGKVPGPDLPSLYEAADLFALPSTGEGFGIAFLEAMACGTPSIGLAVGGAPDALGDGDLGYCVAPDEFPATFASALDAPRPANLSETVRARFGFQVYRERLKQALSLLDDFPKHKRDW
jgi:phosphatidyl-myo-inositol dimannoside synthase